METSFDIAFIILTYFPDQEKIRSLVDALRPHTVLLVDNTPKKTISIDHVIYLPNRENKGYTGGVNRGLRYAYTHNHAWMVVLNDDVQMTKHVVNSFIQSLSECSPGLAGPYPRSLDPKRWTAKTDPEPMRFLSGSFLAIHRDVIRSIGYLHDPYFIFYEEVEYCVRAKNKGFPLHTIPLPNVRHKESSTFQDKPFLHQYYLARNHLLFIERNAPLSVKAYEMLRFPKTILEHVTRREWGALAGIRDYALRRFGRHPYSA